DAADSGCQRPTIVELAELGRLATRARVQLSFIQPSVPQGSTQLNSTTASDRLGAIGSSLSDGAEDLVGVMGGELCKVSAGADAKELARRPSSSATVVAPGEYRLRVGERDAGGRLGAADFEFSAKLTKAGNFDLSDLLVGVQRGDEFVPKFGYTSEPAAFGYM